MLSASDLRSRAKRFFSSAEKFALGGALTLIALHLLLPATLQSALEYREELALSQPWRLFSAHLLHLNAAHVLVNALAWVLVARLFFRELDPLRQLQTLLLGAMAIGLALLSLWPTIGHYRGFSGVLHALYFAGAMTWWVEALRALKDSPALNFSSLRPLLFPSALLLGGVLKVLLESPWSNAMPWLEWLGARSVPQAHAVGALAGLLSGVVFGLADAVTPQQVPATPRQNEQDK